MPLDSLCRSYFRSGVIILVWLVSLAFVAAVNHRVQMADAEVVWVPVLQAIALTY